MRNAFTIPIALLLFTSAALPAIAQTDGDEIPNQLMMQFAEAWGRDDAAAVAAMFAEDALFFDAGATHVGRDAIDAFQSRAMAGTDAMEITPLRSGTSGDFAYQAGRWTLTHAGGVYAGVHTFIFRRSPDGEWLVVSAHVEDADTP